MNPQHLQAFLWLRWRLRLNQLRRGGIANVVILVLLGVLVSFGAPGLFVGFFSLGLFGLSQAPPAVLLYICDGLVGIFLFIWTLGLLVDLQRSETLALHKFLPLPVSVAGVFLINYF